MSQQLAHLCALLIEDTYGPLYSHIFNALSLHGRLSARDISRKCHLPMEQVVAGLAILVQCLLVFHNTAPDGRTSYQANTSAAFNLLRVGKFTQLIRNTFGHDGARIFNHLIFYGNASIDDLRKLPTRSKQHGRSNGLEAEDLVMADYGETDEERSLQRLFKRFVEQEYIVELRPAHFQTWSDTWRAAESVVKASGGLSNAMGKKGKEELEEAVRAEMEKSLNREEMTSGSATKTKRQYSDDAELPAPKKQKRVIGTSSTVSGSVDIPSRRVSEYFDGQAMFRINHTQLLVILRHQMMVRRVSQRMGSQPRKVLAALLRQCEKTSRKFGDMQLSSALEGVNPKDLQVKIDISQLLSDITTIENPHNDENGHNPGLVNGHSNGNLLHADGNLNIAELRDQVATLAEGSCDFIFRDPGNGDWYIDLKDAEQRLRDDEIMRLIKQRLGPTSLRIVRILIDRGKVDEKTLQEIGLLNAKDLRRCLAQLHAHGFIDLQEVPREKERQPVRTIFLWFYDAERVRRRVLETMYKSMCRLLQRLMVERSKVSSTLQKAERSDVKGNEHQMLGGDEINVLKRWRRKELWYLAELDRLGTSVDAVQ